MKTIIAVIFLVFTIIIGLNTINRGQDLFYASLNASMSNETKDESNQFATSISVFITGQVNKPGTYTILSGEYLFDVINLAGGVTDLADEKCFNYYLLLEEDVNIYIPIKSEEEKISINSLSLEELTKISGIGKVIGNRIIEYHQLYGEFMYLEELMKVEGIGESLFNKIHDHICL